MQLSNNLFMITGGGSGLGAATAEYLIEQGANVLLLDINQSAGEQTAARLGANARFLLTDVTAEDSAQAAVQAAQEWGNLAGLINCAGIAPAEKILGRKGVHRLSSFQQAVNINLIGSFNMLRLAAAALAENTPNDAGERGVIINTASVAAYDGQIGQAAYAASKGALVALTLPASRELAKDGIRVMTIAPGIMQTPMLLNMPDEVQQALGNMVPFPARLGKPSEFAQLVAHILGNSYLNGEVIRLDGAIRMQAK